MKFNDEINRLLEDFNISPQYQNTSNNGPDIGTTRGDINGSFPSRQEQLSGKLLPNKKDIKRLKRKKFIPRERLSKNR